MFNVRAGRLLKAALIVAPLAFAVSGCETMEKLNPFAEKQTPLPGVRKPLFPEGVPGVEFGAAPPQPSNSNIPISPAIANPEQPPEQAQIEQRPQPAVQPQPQPQAARAPQPARSSQPASKSKSGNPDDAWDGTR
jgi:hypothetical protein